MTTDTNKKSIPDAGSPVVHRTNALLERIKAFGNEASVARYQLTRPLDGTVMGHASKPGAYRLASASQPPKGNEP